MSIQGLPGAQVAALPAAPQLAPPKREDLLQELRAARKDFLSEPAASGPARRQELAKRIANTIRALSLREEQDAAGAEAGLRVLNSLEWNLVVRTLAQGESSSLILDLLRIHDRLGISVTFAEALTTPLLRGSDEFFARSVQRLGAAGVLEILTQVSATEVRDLSNARAARLMSRMAEAFEGAAQAGSDESLDRWTLLYSLLVKSHELARKCESKVPALAAVGWLERVHRAFEQDLLREPESAALFLKELSSRSLDASWLKYRVLGPEKTLGSGLSLQAVTPGDRLGRILHARLSAHFAEAGLPRKQALDEFCAVLSREGIPSVNFRLDELASRFEAVSAPGCHRISSGQGASLERALPQVEVRRDRIQMSFDSVVQVPDTDLTLAADSVDAGFFDLSSERSWPALPLQLDVPESADAVAFPLVLGFRIQGSDIFRNGVYFLLAHDPFRRALDGPAYSGALFPQEGFRGGVLSLEVGTGSGNHLPVWVSQGGPGQKAVLNSPGGQGSESRFLPNSLDRYLKRNQKSLAPESQVIVLMSPKVSYLKALFESADRDENGRIRVMIPEGYLQNLEFNQAGKLNAQGLRIVEFCRSQGLARQYPDGAPNLARCYTELIGPRFAKMLTDELAQRTRIDQESEVLPFLRLGNPAEVSTFVLEQGRPGPAVPEGASGKAGDLP